MSSQLSGVDMDVIALFEKAVWEVDQKRFDNLQPSAKISSLGIDSVAMLEVIGYLEEELEIHLSDEQLADIETVGDLTDVISRASAAA